MRDLDVQFMQKAIQLARQGMHHNQGGPFGAVVVKDGAIIGEGCNQVVTTNDPTAHAEMVAIRRACQFLGRFQLDGCVIYSSCEPCPMCLGAIYWARLAKIYYGCARVDAAKVGFDDYTIYEEFKLPLRERRIPMERLSSDEALQVFVEWGEKPDRVLY